MLNRNDLNQYYNSINSTKNVLIHLNIWNYVIDGLFYIVLL